MNKYYHVAEDSVSRRLTGFKKRSERAQMKSSEVAILVPAFNEEKSLPDTLDSLKKGFKPSQIVVINDGSEDATPLSAREAGVRVIDMPVNMGIGVTMQTGYRFALRNGFKYAVQCDADGQHRPEEIPLLIKGMESSGADMVIGSRFVDREAAGFKSLFLRRQVIRFFSGWINMLTGYKVHDVTSGFRLVNRRIMELFAQEYTFDFPEPESIILTARRGHKVVEVPVAMRSRQGGVSSIGFFTGLYYMVKVTLGLLLTRVRKKD